MTKINNGNSLWLNLKNTNTNGWNSEVPATVPAQVIYQRNI